jgi:hypothetical protein
MGLILVGALYAISCQDWEGKELDVAIEDPQGVLEIEADWLGMTIAGTDYKIRIVKPNAGIDYKLIIEKPDPAVDYTLVIVDPTGSNRPIPETVRKRLKDFVERLRRDRHPQNIPIE